MPSLSKKKVFKDIPMRTKPVLLQVRDGFRDQEIDLDHHLNDPKAQAILNAAEKEAAHITQEAQAKAQEILTLAQGERQTFVEEARQEGLALGYQEGFSEGNKKAKIIQEKAEALLAEARKAYKGVMVQTEPNLLELSLLIAEKIVRQQVVAAPETIKIIVKELLSEVHAGETFFVHTHPSEAKLLQEAHQELRAAAPPGIALHIVPNRAITEGGCRLETDDAYYDATVEGQLLELKRLLQGGKAHA